MSKFVIKGLNPVSGEIDIKGAKNAALKIIPASLLSKEEIIISNVPKIEDINKALDLLSSLGAKITKNDDKLSIVCDSINSNELRDDLADKFRASIMFVGPILARFREVRFPHPGGCVIGAGGRPIDIFLDGFTALGAKVHIDERFYHIKAKELIGCDYFFNQVSVTATESLMMTATLAKGVTTLSNCAMEPEIKALADYLNLCGAKIKGAGTPTITIEGVKEIDGNKFNIIPDRIETGSFAILAAATKSHLQINNCDPSHVSALLCAFDKIGVGYKNEGDKLTILPSKNIKPYNLKTHEYPGFPTDLQSPFTVLMTQANGRSLIHETIYDRRLLFVDMLSQMGAEVVMCDPHRVVVNGPTKLYGKKLTSPDLRAGIAMIIAASCAEGTTEIDNIYQIDRGYESIDSRLASIGIDIVRS